MRDSFTITGRVTITVEGPEGPRVYKYDNTVATVGKAAIADALWDPSGGIQVSYVELGSGTTAPAAGDTALETPVYRNALASGNNISNVATLTGFFSATETNGTYREAGLYIGGSGTLGTGTLLSHVAINVTKSASETLTIEWSISIT